MNGNNFFLDTNIILYILSGDEIIANYLQKKNLFTSIICEIELFSYKHISASQEKEIRRFLKEFKVITIDESVKNLSIEIRKKYQLKIPDSIIAGSAIAFEIPLVTADKGFKKISKLTIDFYNK